MERSPDPLAQLLEDALRVVQLAVLRLFRRTVEPMVVPFIGHGSARSVQIGARAVLGRPDGAAARLPVPEGGALAPVRPAAQAPARRSRRSVLRSSLSRFLTVEVAGAPITVRVPGAFVTVRSDRDGYLDVAVDDPRLPSGWHEAELVLADGTAVATPVLWTQTSGWAWSATSTTRSWRPA